MELPQNKIRANPLGCWKVVTEVSNQGSDVFHEVMESYYGGQNDPGGTYDAIKWQQSHDKARAADPTAKELNLNLNTKTGQAGLIDPLTGKSVDLRPMTKDEKDAATKKKGY
jgi:hypothetical protein